MLIIKHRKIFFAISVALMLVSVFSVTYFGIRPGIDFAGGSLLEIAYEQRPSIAAIKQETDTLPFSVLLQPSGENNLIVRTKDLSQDERAMLLSALSSTGGAFTESRFTSIGPSIGAELKQKAWIALLLVISGITLFVAFAFRKVSEPISSWKYGLVTIIALMHDVVVPVGAVAFLGSFMLDYQADALFVTALLTVLGFSVHDTIVVFDRVRENLRKNKEEHLAHTFEETVGASIGQTFARSINTSLTVVLVLATLFLFGGASTKPFALILIIGVIAGTYSSVFLASPLLVTIASWQKNKKDA
ncbi:MAG: protein translocase subunit SecF [Patescibacteria group bacterium]